MYHSGTAELDPAGAFTRAASFAVELAGAVAFEAGEIEFGRGFREREVGRPKTRGRLLAEQALEPFCHSALKVGHGNALVDTQPFDLVKHRNMRHIRRIAAEDLPGCDYADRHAAALH